MEGEFGGSPGCGGRVGRKGFCGVRKVGVSCAAVAALAGGGRGSVGSLWPSGDPLDC